MYNLVRGCDPQPGAYVLRGGEKIRLFDARRVHAQASPGVVAAIGADGVTIGGSGGAIRVGRMKAGDKKVAAQEAAAALGLAVGSPLSKT